MPFKDKDKEKAYYHNHKKFYQREFQRKRRDAVNEFQARRKRERIREQVDVIRQQLLSMELGDESNKSFRAIVVMFTLMHTGVKRPQGLSARTGYNQIEINEFFYNWIKAGIYHDGTFEMEEVETDLDLIIQLTLMGLCGSGEVVRYKVKSNEV